MPQSANVWQESFSADSSAKREDGPDLHREVDHAQESSSFVVQALAGQAGAPVLHYGVAGGTKPIIDQLSPVTLSTDDPYATQTFERVASGVMFSITT